MISGKNLNREGEFQQAAKAFETNAELLSKLSKAAVDCQGGAVSAFAVFLNRADDGRFVKIPFLNLPSELNIQEAEYVKWEEKYNAAKQITY